MSNRRNAKPNGYNNCNNGGGYPNQVPNYNVPPQQPPPPNYYPNPMSQQYPPPPGVNDNYYSQNQYGLPPNAVTPPPQQPVYGQPIYYNQPPGMPQPQYNPGKPPAL